MKEAFWGVLIVMLGLVGIVIVNIFQNVTIGNDRTYYLLKESAEAATYDSIDLTYYRLNGDLRMVEDKFVENFTRRFAQSLGNNGNYYISVQEITGKPPRISIKVNTGITSLQGDDFGITNRIDGILETKYKIGDVTSFLGITEEEWLARINVNTETDNACSVTTGIGDLECIPGDLEFTGWGAESIPATVCNAGSYGEESRLATYKTCLCGKWKEETETVKATPVKSGTEYTYNWYFYKDGEIRDIEERTTTRAYVEKCTDAIEVYVPKDLRKSDINLAASEYELCPGGGTTVNQGQTIYWRANYIPSDSSNRKVTWTKPSTDTTISLQYSNPKTDKGYSIASITGKELGTTIVTATTTNGKTATCKVTVLDGNVDTVGCKDATITAGYSNPTESTFTPYTANKTNFTWTSSDTNVATINSTSGMAEGKNAGSTTITVTAPNGKTGTCTLTVNAAQTCRLARLVGTYWQHLVIINRDGTKRQYNDCVVSDVVSTDKYEYKTVYHTVANCRSFRTGPYQAQTCYGWLRATPYSPSRFGSYTCYLRAWEKDCDGEKYGYHTESEEIEIKIVVEKGCIFQGASSTSTTNEDYNVNYVEGYSCPRGTVSKNIGGNAYCC